MNRKVIDASHTPEANAKRAASRARTMAARRKGKSNGAGVEEAIAANGLLVHIKAWIQGYAAGRGMDAAELARWVAKALEDTGKRPRT